MEQVKYAIKSDESVASFVERKLRETIVAAELMPGVRLSEQEIADRYGVSRQPVREALISLSKSGLVEIRPNRGSIVTRISIQDVEEARLIREVVEVAIVKKACNFFDPMMLNAMQINLERQKVSVDEGDHETFRRLDVKFHQMISDGTQSRLAWGTIKDMMSLLHRACSLTLAETDTLANLYAEHCAIKTAIENRDPESATHVMTKHLRALLIDLSNIARDKAEFFE